MVPSHKILGVLEPSKKKVGFSSNLTRQKLVSCNTWAQLDHRLVLVQKKTAMFSPQASRSSCNRNFFVLPKMIPHVS